MPMFLYTQCTLNSLIVSSPYYYHVLSILIARELTPIQFNDKRFRNISAALQERTCSFPNYDKSFELVDMPFPSFLPSVTVSALSLFLDKGVLSHTIYLPSSFRGVFSYFLFTTPAIKIEINSLIPTGYIHHSPLDYY